nr:MAG TPA: hypothetical protein [Caudoviricetes sp.]
MSSPFFINIIALILCRLERTVRLFLSFWF